MDTTQFAISQEDKKWDRVWSTDEIRKNSGNWNLAGDVGLYNLLDEISQKILTKSHEVGNALDNLVHQTKMASVKVNNTINDFHMLSNVQFVENRVYDDEILETSSEFKPIEKTKEEKEAEMIPKIKTAIELGLKVLDQAFNRINVDEISDSEDEDPSSGARTILEPKDPYEHRPLPYIIGSEEFNNCDYAGLKDLIEEELEPSVEVESSVSDTDETSSDEDQLPLDDEKRNPLKQPQLLPQTMRDDFSSSEESELFGSEKDENDFGSVSSFEPKPAEVKNAQRPKEEDVETKQRQSSVSSMQARLKLPQVLPVPKMPEKEKDNDDLFTNHGDDFSDDESPFRKKTGLFSSDTRFDDGKDMFDGGLFGEKPKETKKATESTKAPPIKVTSAPKSKKEEPSLFSNDEDSDDDIFNTLMKTSKTTAAVETSKANTQRSRDQTDSSSTTPSSAPSSKPAGVGFDFEGEGGDLFGDESDADDLFSSKKGRKSLDLHASEDDDLFNLMNEKNGKTKEVSKKLPKDNAKSEEKSSLFEDSIKVDKPYKKVGMPLPGLVPTENEDSIFKEKDSLDKHKKSYQRLGTALPGLTSSKDDSLFKEKVTPSSVETVKTSKKKTMSLFDDDDEEEDMFGEKPRQLMSPGRSPSMKSSSEKFEPPIVKTAEVKPTSSLNTENKVVKSKGLFDDDDDDEDFMQGLAKKQPPQVVATKNLSLFEESDNFDLFTPKPVEPKITPEPKIEATSKKENSPIASKKENSPIASKKENSPIISKKENSPITSNKFSKIQEEKNTEVDPTPVKSNISDVSKVGFDAPAENTQILHVVNKDRARISTKRRRPTKQARHAALDSGSMGDSDSPAPRESKGSTSGDDDLFASITSKSSSEEPTSPKAEVRQSGHKTEEKKKKDIMSQLMSEAALKRSKKSTILEEEDEVDIFSEVARKDKSKSFSLPAPIESKSTPSFPEDDDDDEFFADSASFKKFSSSISQKTPDINLEEEEDDDLFSTAKSSNLKPKTESSENGLFGDDDTDIFANIQKEKYEMFPSQLYDDEDGDEDIFSSMDKASTKKSGNTSTNSLPTKKEVEKKPAFDDPLSGLLGDD